MGYGRGQEEREMGLASKCWAGSAPKMRLRCCCLVHVVELLVYLCYKCGVTANFGAGVTK